MGGVDDWLRQSPYVDATRRAGCKSFSFTTSDSDLHLWARGVAVNAGLEVACCEPEVSPLQLQGPKATGVIEARFGGAVAKVQQ